ncbi:MULTISPECIES: aa3-type cytochrome oxidase subunit II [Micromonospora]|uniref:aa3-type cytochrome oxidase subunit II n=1 Tax=Micromonospora TaxID=1873 RepID=UPI0007DB2CFC|nr:MULTISPECIES: cytochrome c oxidase subunit II [Micromonospora]MBC8991609.1 cytochrome c oxidase subunit II [Micromonospora chalcea]MBP1784761.1 cytochrome c oxidase subunit 2 [Micromonospora sp. HB375]MBQ1063501.1 cytochrome c oxidase subunit II [Micromonospora sp. C41]MDH6471423.1 cytochrome c oxidase subunit 2 [Micromonospora sp. H404/HB375]NHO82179.1 cytochrome c oxidase subunit II [Micromonospora sp. CMU55-4]
MVARSSEVRRSAVRDSASPGAGGRRRRGAGRIAGLGLGAAALLVSLTGCDVGKAFGGFGWPQGGITPESQRMYDLWIASCIAALAVGVFVWGLIFWCVVRYRKRGNELPVQTRYNLPMEFLYTIAPILVVSVLFYYTAVVQTDVIKESKNPDVTVEVVAFKWNWQFNYRDGQGRDANTVASVLGTSEVIPVLVLPSGRSIRFEETSRDVIHSFWVPELLFKRDVMPGNVRNTFEVSRIDQEGAFVGRCAELCGSYHAFMNFELRVVSPEKYDQFLAAKKAGKSTQEALGAIGEPEYATETKPFDTRRDVNNFNPSDAQAGAGS